MKLDTPYELRKDIDVPGRYYPAGDRKTGSEWLTLFPDADVIDEWDDWFIDTTTRPEPASDPILNLVNDVFDKRGLCSISYKEAAVACVKAWQEKLNNPLTP